MFPRRGLQTSPSSRVCPQQARGTWLLSCAACKARLSPTSCSSAHHSCTGQRCRFRGFRMLWSAVCRCWHLEWATPDPSQICAGLSSPWHCCICWLGKGKASRPPCSQGRGITFTAAASRGRCDNAILGPAGELRGLTRKAAACVLPSRRWGGEQWLLWGGSRCSVPRVLWEPLALKKGLCLHIPPSCQQYPGGRGEGGGDTHPKTRLAARPPRDTLPFARVLVTNGQHSLPSDGACGIYFP